MKHILLVCYGGGHMKVLAPLYAELSGRYKVTVLALTSAGAYMREQGVPSLGFRDFAFTRSPEVQAYGLQLAADLPENGVVPREESVAYLGASFFDLVNQLGDEGAAYELYREKGRAAFLPVSSLQKVIAELKIDAVITTNAPRAERAALIAAKGAGLPTVCVNDNLWIYGGIVDVARNGLADRICVLAAEARERLIAETSIASHRVIVTGTPVFDELKAISRVSSSTPDVPRVLLADHSLPEKHPFRDIKNRFLGTDEEVRMELNKLASSGEIEVYFRSHPSENIDYGRFEACKVSPIEENLHERLSKTDVVVTAISTVGVQGIAIGTGLVSIENTVFSTLESYERLGLSTGICSPYDLSSAIYKEFSVMKRRISENLYRGSASENIRIVTEALVD